MVVLIKSMKKLIPQPPTPSLPYPSFPQCPWVQRMLQQVLVWSVPQIITPLVLLLPFDPGCVWLTWGMTPLCSTWISSLTNASLVPMLSRALVFTYAMISRWLSTSSLVMVSFTAWSSLRSDLHPTRRTGVFLWQFLLMVSIHPGMLLKVLMFVRSNAWWEFKHNLS